MNGLGDDAEQRYQQALAALGETGGEAVDALSQEFAALDEDQHVNRWATVQLLHDLRDPRSLDLLGRIIASPLPKERSPDPHGSTTARELVVRTTAVEAIARLAAGGSADARKLLVKHLRHPVRSVKIAAALALVEQEGARVRKELRGRMAKSDHWILDIRRMHPRDLTPLEGHRFLPPKASPEASLVPGPAPGGRTAGSHPGTAAGRPKSGGEPIPREQRTTRRTSTKRSRRKNRKG